MILLVDLETGETFEADADSLRGGNRPSGNWRIASEVTTEEWIAALKKCQARWN